MCLYEVVKSFDNAVDTGKSLSMSFISLISLHISGYKTKRRSIQIKIIKSFIIHSPHRVGNLINPTVIVIR